MRGGYGGNGPKRRQYKEPRAAQGAALTGACLHSLSDLIIALISSHPLPKVRASQLREELQGAQARLAQAEAQSRALERRVSELTQYSAQLEGRVSELERAVAERDQRAERTAREVEGRMREVWTWVWMRREGGRGGGLAGWTEAKVCTRVFRGGVVLLFSLWMRQLSDTLWPSSSIPPSQLQAAAAASQVPRTQILPPFQPCLPSSSPPHSCRRLRQPPRLASLSCSGGCWPGMKSWLFCRPS